MTITDGFMPSQFGQPSLTVDCNVGKCLNTAI